MPLFDDIKKKVADTTQSAVKATKELAETTRLNSQISDEQRKIEGLYSQIGKLYFEKYGASCDEPFCNLCTGIVDARKQIEKLQLSIKMIKGIKSCPECGADVPMTASFCSACGSAVESPDAPGDDDIPSSEPQRCTNCSEILEENAVFCSSCGQKQV